MTIPQITTDNKNEVDSLSKNEDLIKNARPPSVRTLSLRAQIRYEGWNRIEAA